MARRFHPKACLEQRGFPVQTVIPAWVRQSEISSAKDGGDRHKV